MPQITPPSFLPAGYSLAWQDDFDTLDLSLDRTGIHAWYEGVWWKTPNPQAGISARNSVLTLEWQAGQTVPSTDVTSLLAWKYGYFEARMRWTNSPGAWPAFWMIPQNDATATEAGELDILEWLADSPGQIACTLHDWGGNGKPLTTDSRAQVPNVVTLPQGFDVRGWHTYGMLWTPGFAQFYLDGQPTITAATPAICDQGPYVMILSAQFGSAWQVGVAPPNCQTDRLSIDVDYVRVWRNS